MKIKSLAQAEKLKLNYFKKLEKVLIEEKELDEYVDTLEFDWYGRNRFAEQFRKLRKKIERIKNMIDKLENMIETKEFYCELCYYCDDEIPLGTRHHSYSNGISKKICSKQCMKMLRLEKYSIIKKKLVEIND